MGSSLQELLILFAIIGVLIATGWWPSLMRGLRELRGEAVPESGPPDTDDLCYKILGVSSTTPWPEVERAYRTKAKLHHPDKGGDEDTMRALNEAYSRLKKLRRG